MKKILVLAMALPLVISFVLQPTTPVRGASITTYVVPAITDDKILPTTSISLDYVSNRISILASPGEYEPASFVIRPDQKLAGVTVAASALSGASGSIPAANVDIRVVKCWYQAGSANWYVGSKTLIPELLLKDDSLVKLEGGENYLKMTSGEYVWISDDTVMTDMRAIPVAEFPVKDSASLQPLTIPAGDNKQFWVTVKVPDGASAGVYYSTIKVSSGGEVIAEIQLELEVLPIELAQPYLTYSMIYGGDMHDGAGWISTGSKSETQYRAEIQNLVAHGVTAPTFNQYLADPALFAEALDIRRQLGMDTTSLFVFAGNHNLGFGAPTDPATLKQVTQKVAELVAIAKAHGYSNVYFSGIHEVSGAELLAQRPVWEAIHAGGGKVFISAWAGTFEAVGDLLDVIDWPYDPLSAEAQKWGSVGHQIFSYANPQAGVEKSQTYRLNYGLLLWQRDFDGTMTCAYQNHDGAFIWNDFDNPTYRSETFAYPTVDGVVDTIEWEGFREGVDDVRYLTTLLNAIKSAKALGKNTTEAETWLASLKTSDLTITDLGTVRDKMIAYILSFTTGSSSDTTAPVIASVGHSPITSPLATTTITWTTGERANSQVEYGKTTALGLSSSLDTSLVRAHEVTLTGLTANTTYYFRVKSSDATGNSSVSAISTLNTSISTSASFAAPTDSSGAAVARNWTQVNVSVNSNSEPLTSFVDWNRSLVGYWDGNENSGSTAYDESTYGNNATLRNGALWTTGRFGSALKFDGVNDMLRSPTARA